MIGRGAVADPGLALAIKASVTDDAGFVGFSKLDASSTSRIAKFNRARHGPVTWQTLAPLVLAFWQIVTTRLDSKAQAGRLKQWLNFLRRRYPEAEVAYQALKTVNSPAEVTDWLQRHVDCTVPQGKTQPVPVRALVASL